MTKLVNRIAISLGVLALPGAAVADVHWRVNGVFDDGTTLTGTFDIDTYGYLGPSALTTQAQGTFPGFTYTLGDSSAGNTATAIDFERGYTGDLHLVFASNLSSGGTNPIVSGYECVGSYSCYNASGGTIRNLVSGVATVPEPAGWVLLVTGFALAGGTLRAQRRRIA
jgi:hypothetical protein